MIEFNQIIDDLETMKERPNWFINPVTPEILFCYLMGLQRGVFLSQKQIEFHDFVEAHRLATHDYGLKSATMPAYREMRVNGISEGDIIQSMLEIEIRMWQILQQLEDNE